MKKNNYGCLVLRVGELFLKGNNVNYFEKKLLENIKKQLKIKIKKLRFKYIADFFSEHQQLKLVFGLTSYSPAIKVSQDLDLIKKSSLDLLKTTFKGKNNFKVQTKRADKRFSFTSLQLNAEIGKHVESNSDFIFSLNSKNILNIEINHDGAYIFTETISCFSGLPVGVSGKVILLVEDDCGLLAGLLMMKRGCEVVFIHFYFR